MQLAPSVWPWNCLEIDQTDVRTLSDERRISLPNNRLILYVPNENVAI